MNLPIVKSGSKHKILHQQTLFYTLVLVCAIVLISILIFNLCTEKAIDDIVDKSLEMMDIQLDNAKRILQNLNESLFSQYTSAKVIQQLRNLHESTPGSGMILENNSLQEILSEILASENMLQGILLTDTGEHSAYVGRVGFQESARLQQVLSEAKEQIRAYGGATYYETAEKGIVLARMVYNTTTLEHVGYIAFYLNANMLAQRCKLGSESGIPEKWALLMPTGKVLIHDADSAGFWETMLAQSPKQMNTTLETVADFEGARYIFLGQGDSVWGWTLYNATHLERLYIGWRSIISNILIVGLGMFAVLLFFTTFQSMKLSQKINLLLEKIEQISMRKFDETLRFAWEDEFEVLASHLNRLGGEMDHLITENQKSEQLRYEILHAKYSMLQANLNPHLINNFLEIISAQAMMCDVPQISKSVRLFADFLRANIQRSSQMVTLEEELLQVNRYVHLYQSIYPSRVDVRYEVEPGLKDLRVPSFILQPLVENAIVHGAEHSHSMIHISLRCTAANGTVALEVLDDSIGITPEDLQTIRSDMQLGSEESADRSSSHFGLRSIHMMLRLRYGEPYGVTINSELGKWTHVRLSLPMEDVWKSENMKIDNKTKKQDNGKAGEKEVP